MLCDDGLLVRNTCVLDIKKICPSFRNDNLEIKGMRIMRKLARHERPVLDFPNVCVCTKLIST